MGSTRVVPVSHDAAANTTLVRQLVPIAQPCSHCGQHRGNRGLMLFRYGTRDEATQKIRWHKGYFDRKACHDSHHNSR